MHDPWAGYDSWKSDENWLKTPKQVEQEEFEERFREKIDDQITEAVFALDIELSERAEKLLSEFSEEVADHMLKLRENDF